MILKRLLIFIGLALLGYGTYYLGLMMQVLTGFGAKQLCSCVFVSHRSQTSVLADDLNRFPYSLATYEINQAARWAESRMGPWTSRRAIYRDGMGCVLLTDTEKPPDLPALVPPVVEEQPLPESQAMTVVDYERLNAALDRAFAEPDADRLQNTKAVVVLYGDTLVAERYAPGISADTPLPGWSMAKSVTNALVGILVREGELSVSQPVPVAAWQKDQRQQITINDLLRMQSGLAWNETYFAVSDVTQMIFLSEDMSSVAVHQPLAHPPGTVWSYSSGTTNIVSQIIREAVGEKRYPGFPYQALFAPLGMSSAVWETDLTGTFVGSSYLLATARDWAKFGSLYLNDGVWQGQRILPEGWVDYTTTPVTMAPQRQYGAHFWLNSGESGDLTDRPFPNAPTDCYFAQGFDGQNVFIIPSYKLVMVRLGTTTPGNFDQNQFLSEVLASFPKNAL